MLLLAHVSDHGQHTLLALAPVAVRTTRYAWCTYLAIMRQFLIISIMDDKTELSPD